MDCDYNSDSDNDIDAISSSNKSEQKSSSKTNKKRKYNSSYQIQWEKQFTWLSKITNNNSKAKCTLCDKEFSIRN